MSIVPISADVAAMQLPTVAASMLDRPEGGVFEQVLNALEGLNGKLLQANGAVQELANGSEVNLHQTVLSLEQARMSLELTLQVRNKVLEAYQEVMRMQI